MRVRLLLVALFCASLDLVAPEERLPGWQGEKSRTDVSALRGGEAAVKLAPAPWVEQISWSPRAWVYHGFLSEEECDHLVKEATPSMERSGVVDNASGKSKEDDIRTSSGMFFRRGQDEVIRRIEERISAFAMVPADHGEGIQVLHYAKGQKYDAHFDYFHDKANQENGGQRVATVLLYLSEVESGGETVFPSGKAGGPGATGVVATAGCGKGGLAVKPVKGDALLFWSLKLDGHVDEASLHAGCPVVAGDKWTATKWMRVGKMNGV